MQLWKQQGGFEEWLLREPEWKFRIAEDVYHSHCAFPVRVSISLFTSIAFSHRKIYGLLQGFCRLCTSYGWLSFWDTQRAHRWFDTFKGDHESWLARQNTRLDTFRAVIEDPLTVTAQNQDGVSFGLASSLTFTKPCANSRYQDQIPQHRSTVRLAIKFWIAWNLRGPWLYTISSYLANAKTHMDAAVMGPRSLEHWHTCSSHWKSIPPSHPMDQFLCITTKQQPAYVMHYSRAKSTTFESSNGWMARLVYCIKCLGITFLYSQTFGMSIYCIYYYIPLFLAPSAYFSIWQIPSKSLDIPGGF